MGEIDWESPIKSACSSKNVILVDLTNNEAICTAHIIRDLLTELLASRAPLIPSVLNAGEDLPTFVEKVLVVCSDHCFQSVHFCHSVLAADDLRSTMITIVPEEAFEFTANRLYADLIVQAGGAVDDIRHYEELVAVAKRMFADIVVPVYPLESEPIIRMRVKAIAIRI